eukprot:TRINITY_DN6176_c2_g1_i1.p1 TRINITY_DN6176_c2_g1~~TRINITY_DN6176_c2_g1_i1.p1  ORF type:complete len:599 (+),score=221.91 TRINITY_DN6176_c2_g1_i1:77-1798(+)
MSGQRHLLNKYEGSALVEEALDGLCEMHPHVLARLDGFSEGVKVIVRRDFEEVKAAGRVSVISGGGSGHEPAHAGLVGEGMLTAAVCGDVFASPQTKAVLAAIVATTGPAGCLVVIKNYTGDRLNFGLAVEQAKAQFGLRVEMLIVADDVSLDTAGHRARGIAGTALVHKAAGAAAAAGRGLADVLSAAQRVSDAVRTMGVALSPCCLPGRQPDVGRLSAGAMEVGMGIHGEPGARKAPAGTAAEVCDMLLSRITEVTGAVVGPAVLLVNSLGSMMPLEMTAVTLSALEWCKARGISVVRYASGAAVTSLDMHGFSISLLPADQSTVAALDQPTAAPGWVPMREPATATDRGRGVFALPSGLGGGERPKRPAGEELSAAGKVTAAALRAACESIVAAEPLLTELDTRIGDGDCGTTLKQGAEAVLAAIDTMPLNDAADTAFAVGDAVAASMGGTSGALYHIGSQAAGGSLRRAPADYAAAFCAAVDALHRHGGAGVGSGTMMDALTPAAETLRGGGTADKAAAAAAAGAAATADMTASHGRAAYVAADAQQGTRDPGAVAVATWLAAVAKAVQ